MAAAFVTSSGWVSIERLGRGEHSFLGLEPAPAAALAVVCGGREVCGARYGIDRRDFPVTLDRAEATVIGLR
jgi:hypothetical protein